jgi:pimeloyl-ACP methyl ester carboxylesterase
MRTVAFVYLVLPVLLAQPAAQKKQAAPPPIVPKTEELATLKNKVDELDKLLQSIAAKRPNPDHLTDVEIYSKAGHFLLEFPQTFFTQTGIDQSITVLDEGLARARQLAQGQAPWAAPTGRKILAYRSALDGSVQPYGITLPPNYDPAKPARLYVWLHGRNQVLTESTFLATFPKPNKGLTYAAADNGQIVLDCYGRWNNANHWAGEVDVFEAIADVSRRFKIDKNRIVLRGFSLGGAGAWHIALQYPSFFAAAEIGAGTYPRRAYMDGFPDYQKRTLRIWENILDWSLNAFNIPIAAHDGDSDSGASGLPPEPGVPNRGQLESSLRVRAQLAKEGFPSEGTPNFYKAKGTPSIFLISENTGHSISPLVRSQVDAFLKEHGDRGLVSPDEVKFVTFTTRYNTAHWVTVDALEKHYERSELFARRDASRAHVTVTTKNLTHFTLREMGAATELTIDGQKLKFRATPELHIAKLNNVWRLGTLPPNHKTHALQGPIDDAFLGPFLLVRPTGAPWNKAANEQAQRILSRFDRVYARYYRAHPRVKDDRDVTKDDIANYNLILFGDPASNTQIAKILSKLPIQWTKEKVSAGSQSYPSNTHLPALIYPNPGNPRKYIVLNSGLTIDEREYHSDYSMPKLGDIAILKVGETETPEPAWAALFDEFWRL